MINTWWFGWIAFMCLFLIPPLGYGWGYRGWGAPYPRYLQRRRMDKASGVPAGSSFDHLAWGWRGDVMWLALLVWVIWPVSTYWWR